MQTVTVTPPSFPAARYASRVENVPLTNGLTNPATVRRQGYGPWYTVTTPDGATYTRHETEIWFI